jgi:hypothetical protein
MKMNRMKVFFGLVMFSIICFSCHGSKKAASSAVNQGIAGFVKESVGNRMPSPDAPLSEPKGLKTTVYVYEVTNISQVDRTGTSPFYTAIRSKFIKSVETDESGHFAIDLPVGSYSLFTKKDGKFYGNSFDTQNNINLGVVEEHKVTRMDILVTTGNQ